MDKYILLKTKNNNHYYFSDYYSHFYLIQPIMFDIMKDLNKGVDIVNLLLIQSDFIKLNQNEYSRNDINYYLKKLTVLEKNYHFDSKPIKWLTTLNKKLISYEIFTKPHIVFETTSRCNLKCEYCGWGEYYDNYGVRNPENLDFNKAKLIIDYILELSLKHSGEYNIIISLGFYGGEPLLNYPFIYKVVEYAKKLENCRVKFRYSIATNGVLISKYQEFLISNDFIVQISLDGDRFANSYRVFHDGKPSYDRVVNSINKLKKYFPDHYKQKVLINSVMHNRNNIGNNIAFFKKLSINESLMMSSLSTIGIPRDKITKFKEQFLENPTKTTNHFKCFENDFNKFNKLSTLAKFHHNRNIYRFSSYSSLLYPIQVKNKIRPTSTCNPFNRKMFVTTNGEIFACEKIGHTHLLGFIDDKKVNIDFKKIISIYKDIFNNAIKICSSCARVSNCQTCIYEILNSNGTITKCDGYISQSKYSHYLLQFIEEIEENPNNYYESITNFQYS